MKKYDLTTKQGLIEAQKNILKFHPLYLGYKLLDKIVDIVKNTPEQQKKTATELIEAGKRSGVSEMEITMQSDNGLQLDIPTQENVTINCKIGNNNKVTMKVKYK